MLTPAEIESEKLDKFVEKILIMAQANSGFEELNYLPLWCLGIARSFIHRGGHFNHPNQAIRYLSSALRYGFRDIITEGRIHCQRAFKSDPFSSVKSDPAYKN